MASQAYVHSALWFDHEEQAQFLRQLRRALLFSFVALLIILLVVFVVVMLVWLLAKTGALAANTYWLAFIAVLVLGVVVFLVGSGVVVGEGRPVR